MCIFSLLRFRPYHPVSFYFALIASQENTTDAVQISETEIHALEMCLHSGSEVAVDDCVRNFYDNLTMHLGVRSAFEHLAFTQRNYPELIPSCHYISHGIGHASLRLNRNDIQNAFTIMHDSALYKNIASCGNGYFHGLIEEYTRAMTPNQGVSDRLRSACEATKNRDCYHGIGHAAFNIFAGANTDAVQLCDAITKNPVIAFSCYSGIFMESASDKYAFMINGQKVLFKRCEEFIEPYRAACYIEQSAVLEKIPPRDTNYASLIRRCAQISDPLDRMACIKLMAIRSVRIAHFTDIRALCSATQNRAERIMCTAVVADKIGRSIDQSMQLPIYMYTVRDICSTLNPYENLACQHISFNEGWRLFFTSPADLTFPTITRDELMMFLTKTHLTKPSRTQP